MKKTTLAVIGAVCVVALAVCVAWLRWSDQIARYVWDHWRGGSAALILDRHDANLALQIGMANFGTSNYNLPAALPAFRKAVAIEPGILWGHYEIARILFAEDDLAPALQEIDLELHYNPENLRSLYVRALIEGYSGDYPDAESDLRRFVAWAPTEWAGYNDLGWVLAQEGKYAAVEQDIQAAFTSATGASTNPWLWNTLGVAQLNLGQYQDALASFQKAQSLAAAMTAAEWQQAYPGDAPGTDAGGLAAFQQSIAHNLAQAQSSGDK